MARKVARKMRCLKGRQWLLVNLFLAMVLVGQFTGCTQSNPGNWPQQQVEEKVKSNLKLSEISLTPRPEGGYSGTGKTSEGEAYKLQVTQDPARKRLEWKFESDRGDIGDAYYEFE